jgi:hypothetical protein
LEIELADRRDCPQRSGRLALASGSATKSERGRAAANSSPVPFIAGIKVARERIVARSDEDRESFLRKRGFSKSETAKIVETVLSEEDTKPQSIFDFVAGHHGARSQQDPSGRPPRIGGQRHETVGARRLTERAARAFDAARLTVCLKFRHY